MRTYSSFVGRAVETQSGRPLGKVRDLRASIARGRRPTVEAIVVGRRGFLEHLGVGKAASHRPNSVPWESVVKIEGKRIVVADGTELV
jgi:sporulation protein YlmC with PRC-barrel domain